MKLNKHNAALQLQMEKLSSINKALNDELILLRIQVDLLKTNNIQLINILSKGKVTNITNNITHFDDF